MNQPNDTMNKKNLNGTYLLADKLVCNTAAVVAIIFIQYLFEYDAKRFDVRCDIYDAIELSYL